MNVIDLPPDCLDAIFQSLTVDELLVLRSGNAIVM
jgi:hypothetical protein